MTDEPRDFFISYAEADQAWAEWMADALETSGLRVGLKAWDVRPGHHTVHRVQELLLSAQRVLVILSPNYLGADEVFSEWASAFRDDPKGKDRRLIPIRVEPCAPVGFLADLEAIDLVGLDLDDALLALYDGLKARQPKEATPFPAPPNSELVQRRDRARRRRKLWLFVAVATVVAMLIGFGVFVDRRYFPKPPSAFIDIEPGIVIWTWVNGPPKGPVELTHRYRIQRTEVTQRQWFDVMGTNPAYFSTCGEDCPIERVSYYDAVRYLNRLSKNEGLKPCYVPSSVSETNEQDGCQVKGSEEPGLFCDQTHWPEVKFVGLDCAGYRLPTEAEWVHAARAGTSGDLGTGASLVEGLRGQYDAPVLDPIAWYGGNSQVTYPTLGDWCADFLEKQIPDMKRCGPHPVGTRNPNPWGLVDTLGNVWEWMHDQDDFRRVVDRGGGFLSEAIEVRIDVRGDPLPPPYRRALDLGFRAAQTVR